MQVGNYAIAFLQQCGYSNSQIDAWMNETTLFRDLDFYGDDVYDILLLLHKSFGVNLSDMNPWDYFPPEGSREVHLLTDRWLYKLFGIKRDRRYVW